MKWTKYLDFEHIDFNPVEVDPRDSNSLFICNPEEVTADLRSWFVLFFLCVCVCVGGGCEKHTCKYPGTCKCVNVCIVSLVENVHESLGVFECVFNYVG